MSSSVAVPLPKANERSNWTFHVMMLAVGLSITTASFLLTIDGPTNVVLPWLNIPLPPTCAMQRTTGIDCPGCGLTRSFISLADGDLSASLAFNPAGILMFAMIAFQIPYRVAQIWRLARGLKPWNLTVVCYWYWGVIAVVVMVQWVAKFV
ncbi:DUF2752 domain-containing protein [Bremerella sp. JC817]|uniref:DUF2752 domain-containing protein n=1 Tax=Bremerella sp. JC817 TaxID=3231756 RepID=UPI0034594418